MLDLRPQHRFLVGIDSDGCAFDTMELKHKECFIPAFVHHYHLQGVSKYAREAAEFVNLYSKSRGCNRFHALIEQLAWLGRRPEVRSRGAEVQPPPGVVAWTKRESKLANPARLPRSTEDGRVERQPIVLRPQGDGRQFRCFLPDENIGLRQNVRFFVAA